MKAVSIITLLLITKIACAQISTEIIEAPVAKSVVERLILSLDGYVFPDKAADLRAYLQQHMHTYEAIKDPRALAERLTGDMRAIANDRHLTVSYSERPREHKESPNSPRSERAHRLEEARGFGIRSVARLPGNVGFIDMAYFADDPEAASALDACMALLHGSDALIIDLRRNIGGHPAMVERLLTYLFSEQVQLTSIVWREGGRELTDEQWTLVYVPGDRMPKTPVFVLVSAGTFSAAEQFAYDLKTLHRATLIGHATGGGANPAAATQSLGPHFDAFIPTGRAVNPVTKTNWEGVGVQPDVETKFGDALVEGYKRALQAIHPSVSNSRLDRARERAMFDPAQALHDAGIVSD